MTKALTLHQPWASLCVPLAPGEKPVKDIETRSKPTEYRGRLLIHAGQRQVHSGHFLYLARRARTAGLIGAESERRFRSLDVPFGAIVGACTVVDVVPILGPDDAVIPAGSPCLLVTPEALTLWGAPDYWHNEQDEQDVSGQHPYGDFTPGRYAWLLEDAKRTDERCPACWGKGGEWRRDEGGSWEAGRPISRHHRCTTCAGEGSCDPIAAKGRQGLWEWTP